MSKKKFKDFEDLFTDKDLSKVKEAKEKLAQLQKAAENIKSIQAMLMRHQMEFMETLTSMEDDMPGMDVKEFLKRAATNG